mgnify:CR=1 FL=1
MADYVRAPHYQNIGEPQERNTLCWLAGYTMLYRWKGWDEKSIRSDILSKLDAAGINLDDARQSGLKLKDNFKAAKALGINAMGYGQPVTESDLRQLVRQSPVWAAGQWMSNNLHVYVIVGISENWVELYDPWYDSNRTESLEVQKRPLDWVLNGDGNAMKGLAHTFQWFPLQYWKA